VAVTEAATKEVNMKKKDKIRKLLEQGNSPLAIHKLIGVNVCYVQQIKAVMEAEMWKAKYHRLLEKHGELVEQLEQKAA
jgi:hypothetical protein